MENIVDTHFLLTTIVGAHNAFATLFEAVDEVAKHGLIDIGIGHVVEVATDNTGIVGRLDEVGYHIGLTGTHGHAAGIVAIDKADEGIVLDRTALELVLGHVMEGAVETGGLQVDVEHTHNTTVDIDVGPHGTIVSLFEKHGLDVEIIEFQSASDQSVAYEAGELDGMMTDMIVQSLINKSSAEDGMKTVAMAFGGDASEGRFIVASSPDSGISAPEQLAGSKIGISENTMMEYLVGRYLEDLGVDLASVEMVNIPKLTLRLDLLMEGSDIQAAILPDPLAIEAESRGCGTVIDDTKLGKNYSQSVVTLRKTLIEDGTGTLDAFRAAYNEAIGMINANPDAYLDLFYEKANVAEPLQGKYAVPSYTPDCVPTEEDVASIEEFMVKKGLLDSPFTYEEMVAQ